MPSRRIKLPISPQRVATELRAMPELTVALSRLNVFVTPVIAVGLAERANAHAWGSARLGILTGLIGGKTDTARKDWQRGRGSPRA